MPIMDGHVACKRINQIYKRLRQLKRQKSMSLIYPDKIIPDLSPENPDKLDNRPLMIACSSLVNE